MDQDVSIPEPLLLSFPQPTSTSLPSSLPQLTSTPPPPFNQVEGIDHVSMLPPSPMPVHQNESVEMLMNWKNSGTSSKLDAEVNHLVKDVLLDPKFKAEDLLGFSVAKENQWSNTAEKKNPFSDSFQTANINIEVPSGDKSIPPPMFSVPGLLYWKFTTVI